MEEEYAIGLDLGTTFSCIGVYRNGGVEIIPNRISENKTPSNVIIKNNDEILIGEDTLDNLVEDYDCSIYGIKRFIGRKYEELENEISKENLPFNIVPDKTGKYPQVLIDKNNQKIEFTLEEISSFIIRKMVDNAESYLGNKVNKLVITAPANFNDAQRKCIKQAAELAGVEVLRIINEPTAAALAYGLGTETANNNEEKIILVFDSGGGTFEVTILKINQDVEHFFNILSTKGDKFLGGEDFDNKLADFVLDRFCKKMNLYKEEIKKDRKSMKKLKISCENIKRALSSRDETTLYIKNFYKNNDIFEIITRADFENQCSDLFDKLKKPIDDALIDASLTKEQIKEVVLVGGSSRIPKIKTFLKDYFNIKPNNNQQATNGTIINDLINPDEAVAYGATLLAAQILNKKDKDNKFTGYFFIDITPLSLGVEVKNTTIDPEVQKEGHLMNVFIKRGTKIPFMINRLYQTLYDNITGFDIVIFEGEKKYTKYNNLLGKVELRNLLKRKKGGVKIDIKFFIDLNGILNVTATEQSTGNRIKTKFTNDAVGLTDEDIERIKQKNKKLMENVLKNEKIDYANLKFTLKEFKDAYNEADEDEDKYNILLNYNTALEELIDSIYKEFDNETMVEKYYIIVKQLIKSYIKVLNMKSQITKEDQENIIKNIKNYIKIFTEHNSYYLDDLIEIMKEMNKKDFYEIVINIIEQLNECGKKCLAEKKLFCKYHSLKLFEKADSYFKKYIVVLQSQEITGKAPDKCKIQRNESTMYINDITTGAILFKENSMKSNGFTWGNLSCKNLHFHLSPQEEYENYQIILNVYEKLLIDLRDQKSKEKAICIANILKIAVGFLGEMNYKKYFKLAKDCLFLVDSLHLDKNEEWYKDFEEIYKEIEYYYQLMNEDLKEMKYNIKEKYRNKFDEIDNMYITKRNDLEFINYILQLKPYNGYDEDKKNIKIDFKNVNQDLLKYLTRKYHPEKYTYSIYDEESQLNYCLIESIDLYLNKMYHEY